MRSVLRAADAGILASSPAADERRGVAVIPDRSPVRRTLRRERFATCSMAVLKSIVCLRLPFAVDMAQSYRDGSAAAPERLTRLHRNCCDLAYPPSPIARGLA